MRRRLAAIPVSLLVVGVVATVAVAVIIAVATIGGNALHTDEFAGMPDLMQVALVAPDGDCLDPALEWTTATTVPLFDDTPLAYTFPDQFGANAPYDLCIRSHALLGEVFGVVASTLDVSSAEAAGCPDVRESSVGDTTCGVGEGELGSGLVIVYVRKDPSDPGAAYEGDCISPDGGGSGESGREPLEEGQSALLAVLRLDAMCRYAVHIETTTPYPDIQKYSTDTLTFDLRLEADDAQTTLPALP